MLGDSVYAGLDERLGPVDARLRRAYPAGSGGPGDPRGFGGERQPVHSVCVPADRFHAEIVSEWREHAMDTLRAHPPPPFHERLGERVLSKLDQEPIEHLFIDFEDGYGVREDAVEDAAARTAAKAVSAGPMPPFLGLRCKSLEAPTRRRAVRTLDVFLDALGPPPAGFAVILPKVSAVEQVTAMAVLCDELEAAHGLPAGGLRLDVQVETPAAVLAPDGTATVARLIAAAAAAGRPPGTLHYGTYDYSAACGIAAAYQSLDHPVADHAKAVVQVAAAGTGVRLCDGSTNVLPVGDTPAVHAAWGLHARLVRRSLERGFYQGWDLHPAQLPTRYAATYAFYRDGLDAATGRLRAYLDRAGTGVLDEPATARALAGFLLRGLGCGALGVDEVGLAPETLATL